MRHPISSISTAGIPSWFSRPLMWSVTSHFSLYGTSRHFMLGLLSRMSRATSLVMSYYLLLRASEGQGTSLTMNRLHSGSLYPAAARASSADALSGNRCIVLWCYVGVNVQIVRRPRTSQFGYVSPCVTQPGHALVRRRIPVYCTGSPHHTMGADENSMPLGIYHQRPAPPKKRRIQLKIYSIDASLY
jgi:hypothetical protein